MTDDKKSVDTKETASSSTQEMPNGGDTNATGSSEPAKTTAIGIFSLFRRFRELIIDLGQPHVFLDKTIRQQLKYIIFFKFNDARWIVQTKQMFVAFY